MNYIETPVLREGHGGPIHPSLPSHGAVVRHDPRGGPAAAVRPVIVRPSANVQAERFAAQPDVASPLPARDGGLRARAKAFVAGFRMRLEQRAEARAIRMTAHELAKLSDHSLRDIGFIRGSIESALRENGSQGRGVVRR